jgi:ABC-2 type transport system permease protein
VRDTSRPVPFLPAARGVFGLTLEGMVWSRRTLLMAVLLGLPMLLAVVYRAALAARTAARFSGFDAYGTLVALYYVRNVLPLAALFYATALIADEVEGKTITYLLTRPIQRPAILVGKFAAYLVTTLCLTLPPLVITFFVMVTAGGGAGLGAYVPHLFQDMGVLALTLLAYGALFTLLGVMLRRPMIVGLLFLFFWELLANVPGYMPRLTLTAYLRSLVSYRPAQEGFAEVFGQVLPTALCLEVLGVASALFLAAAAWIFSQREFVLDQ